MFTPNFSDPEEKRKYLKKLFGISFILFGSFFVVEHIWTWGEFSFYDLIGHEWLGFLLILLGIAINLNFSRSRLSEEIKNVFERCKKILKRK